MAADGEIVRGSLAFTTPNASAQFCVFWYEINGNPDDADVVVDIGSFFEDFIVPAWSESAAVVTVAENIDFDVINPDGTVDRNLGSWPIGVGGSIAGDQLPSQNSYYIRMDTNAPKVRGRKYFPGVPEGRVTNGVATAPTVAELITLLGFILDVVSITGSGSAVPGVLSRVLQAFVAFNDTGAVDDIIRTQRRRYIDVGV